MALTDFGNVASAGLGDSVFDMRSTLIALCLLDRGPEPTPTDLQRQTRLSTSGVTRLLDRMEEAGWIRRRYGANVEDRRHVHIALTAGGRRQIKAMVAAIEESLQANQPVLEALRTALEPFLR